MASDQQGKILAQKKLKFQGLRKKALVRKVNNGYMYIYTTFNTKEITRIYMHGRVWFA